MKKKLLITPVVGMLGVLLTSSSAGAQISFISPTPALSDPATAATTLGYVGSGIPMILFFLVAVSIVVFIVIVLIKALNPFSDDQEEKYKEGRKWFTNAGIIIAAPVIVFTIIIVLQGILNIRILPEFDPTTFTGVLTSMFTI